MTHTFFPEIISLLIERGADKSIKDKDGNTALSGNDSAMCRLCLMPCFWIVIPCLCVSFCETREILRD